MSKITNRDRFLKAANWALKKERDGVDVGINIRRLKMHDDEYATLFNVSKGLLYEGYSHKNQQILKGLIVHEFCGAAVEVLAACLPKFYNMGESEEKKSYMKFLKRKGVNIIFAKKEDGVNIRPWYDDTIQGVQFATRGMPMGMAIGVQMDEEDGNLDFGSLAREIAREKYPVLLNEALNIRYSMVFEMIHPASRIVTDYGDRKDLVLLAVFDKENECRELTREELVTFAQEYMLTLAPTWMPPVANTNFEEAVQQLQALWDQTDDEGTVATFVRAKDGEPLYRLKIKNSYYLQLLRLMKFCTLKSLREMVETNNLSTWEQVRAKLYETPSMNEELEMAYKQHYEDYITWQIILERERGQIYCEYIDLPEYESQKDFALAIVDHPLAAYFFEMRKFEQRGGDIASFWLTPNEKLQRLLEKTIPLSVVESVDEAA